MLFLVLRRFLAAAFECLPAHERSSALAAPDAQGFTPLHWACFNGKPMVRHTVEVVVAAVVVVVAAAVVVWSAYLWRFMVSVRS